MLKCWVFRHHLGVRLCPFWRGLECTLGNLGAGSITGEPRVEPRVLSLYKHGGLGGCGVRIPMLVQYVSCQVEGVAARGKMGVAAAAKE